MFTVFPVEYFTSALYPYMGLAKGHWKYLTIKQKQLHPGSSFTILQLDNDMEANYLFFIISSRVNVVMETKGSNEN